MRDRVKKFLSRMFYQDKVPSSVILYGKEGIGKKDLGFEFAMSLLCHERVYPPCGVCVSCKHIKVFYQKKPEELKFYGEDKRGKKVYLYIQGDHPDFIYLMPEKGEIKIDQIRGVKDFVYLSPALSKRKVVFIEPADAMNPFAQNALLKVLEEPPYDTHFILIAHRLEKLLPTVLSRSFLIQVPPLTTQELREIAHIEDPFILELAEGSIKIAIDLKEHVHILNTAKDIIEGDILTLYKRSLEVESWNQQDQSTLLRILQAMLHKRYMESKDPSDKKALDLVSMGLEYLNKGIRLSLLLFQLKGGNKNVSYKSKISGHQQNSSS